MHASILQPMHRAQLPPWLRVRHETGGEGQLVVDQSEFTACCQTVRIPQTPIWIVDYGIEDECSQQDRKHVGGDPFSRHPRTEAIWSTP